MSRDSIGSLKMFSDEDLTPPLDADPLMTVNDDPLLKPRLVNFVIV
jgi:hypothetical protein